MDPDDLDKGLADLEKWLSAWITGQEETPGFVERELLKAQGSEWRPAPDWLDRQDILQRMLGAVQAMQRMRAEQRHSGRSEGNR
jgi:hypothetical protein